MTYEYEPDLCENETCDYACNFMKPPNTWVKKHLCRNTLCICCIANMLTCDETVK